jgi:hypothetical protein
MKCIRKTACVLIALLCISVASPAAYAQNATQMYSGEDTVLTKRDARKGLKFYDALIVKPLSAVGTVLGFGVFVATLPFTLPSGTAEDAWHTFVREPANDFAYRDLGDHPENVVVPVHED